MTTQKSEHLTREQILDTVASALRIELKEPELTIGPEDELDLLPNADSVRLMRVVASLERHYGLEFDDTAIRSATTISDMIDLVQSGLDESGAPR